MRALAYNGPWDLILTDLPEPAPNTDTVVIDVLATGICGSDLHGYTGDTGRRVAGQVMGHESVGRVVNGGSLPVGTIVTFNPIISCGTCNFCAAGDTQVCLKSEVVGVAPELDGSFAERIGIPSRNVIALSASAPLLHGALVEPLAVGYHAVMRGEPRADDRLLIVGGGPIGQAAAIGARRAGVEKILVSEPTDSRRTLLEALGFSTTTPDSLDRAVSRALGGPASLVIDAVGIESTVSAATSSSTNRARIVLVGMGANRMAIEPYGFTVGERTLVGSYCYSEHDFASTAAWVSEGHAELDLLIDRVVPLVDGAEAFRSLADGSGDSNKTLLVSHEVEVAR